MVEALNPQTKMGQVQNCNGILPRETPPFLASLCEECGANPFKYRCPGCSIQTCSLPCVKSHKKRTECNGKRDRAQFIPLSQFSDAHLMSDYNLLEKTKRVADSARRMRRGLIGDIPLWVHTKLKEVRRVAHTRKINILILPSGMTMRKKNQSFVHKWKKSIHWTIEWSFYSTNVVLINHGVDEHNKLRVLLEKHLEDDRSLNMGTRYKLRPFLKEPLENLKFLIRETVKGTTSPFRELDIDSGLREQLADITLLEFPVIHVVLPSHFDKFGFRNYAQRANSNVLPAEPVSDEPNSLPVTTENESLRKDFDVQGCDFGAAKIVYPISESIPSISTGLDLQDGVKFDVGGTQSGISDAFITEEKFEDPRCIELGDPKVGRLISTDDGFHVDTVNLKDKQCSNDILPEIKDQGVDENVDILIGDILRDSCFSKDEGSDGFLQDLDCGFLMEEDHGGFEMLEDMLWFDEEGLYRGDISMLGDKNIGDGDQEDGEII